MRLITCSRTCAKDLSYTETDKIVWCISINDSNVKPLNLGPYVANTLRLTFDDIGGNHIDGLINFDIDTAKQIHKFTHDAINKGVDVLMIHCHAGVRRSPSIAKALSEIYKLPYTPVNDILVCPYIKSVMECVW